MAKIIPLEIVAKLHCKGMNIMIKRFMMEEEGQTLVEYGLLVSLIALVVIAVLTVLGKKVSNTFNASSNSLASST